MIDDLVQAVNDRCTIVDVPERHVVGVRTVFDAESKANVFQVARKYITNGTTAVLERMVGNASAGMFAGVATDIQGGGRLAYVVGVEVGGGDDLPEGLPENTATCVCPGGRFAKTAADGDQMAAYEYFVTGFREDTSYVCDTQRLPCHVYDSEGRLRWIYEPVKIPRSEDERFDSVRWEVITLPRMNVAVVKRDASEGDHVIGLYFAVQEGVRSLPCAASYLHQYLGFPYRENGVEYACFGSQVDSFAGVPDGIDAITLEGGLFVHLMTHELNGDNPALMMAAHDKIMAAIAGRYTRDPQRDLLFRFHLGMSAQLYVPISATQG